VNGDDFTKAHLAWRAWFDGKQDGLVGMLAVACVIRGRARAGWQNGDWLAILLDHQRTAAEETSAYHVLNGGFPILEFPHLREPDFERLLRQIDGIFEGMIPDTPELPDGTPPPLYYCSLTSALRPWFLENICRKPDQHPRVGQVGQLVLFA
jgi:hypothetical protein